MSFQTKDFLSISASLINRTRTLTPLITDYSVGSVARTLLEAEAQEIDELYQQMLAGLVQAIPVAVYRSFDFSLPPPVAAGGMVRVSVTPSAAALLIPAGSIMTQAATTATYASTADVSIPPGASYADVPVVATVSGLAGNLGAGTAFTFSAPPPGFTSATNLLAFINGQDAETEQERKTRFNAYIRTIGRGTSDALRFGATDQAFLTDANGNVIERARFIGQNEPNASDSTQPPGWVQLYVHNGVGGTSPALVARVAQVLAGYVDANGNRVPGYKAAGAKLDVAAATEVQVSLTGTVTGPATAAATAVSTVATYIGGLDIGATCVIAKIVELVMEIPGVTDFTLTGAPTNVTSTYATKLMPGTLTFTAA